MVSLEISSTFLPLKNTQLDINFFTIIIFFHQNLAFSVLFVRIKKKFCKNNLFYFSICHLLQYSLNNVDEARDNHAQQIERAEIGNLVRSRMESLNLPSNDYDECSEKRNHLSYVIINPSCDLKLEEGDLM
jgi:hypothetical protein